MWEHFTAVLLTFGICIAGLLFKKVIQVLEKSIDTEASTTLNDLIDRAVADAVLAIEEESNAAPEDNKPKGEMKRRLAIGLATRILSTNNITVAADILLGKVDAAVRRLLR